MNEKTILPTAASQGIGAATATRLGELGAHLAAHYRGEAAVTDTLAMREWVPPEELAETIAFLAEGKVRHLSGATLDVNGATYVR